MDLINGILNFIFDLVLFPIRINLLWGLIFITLVTGILMLVIFKYTSNQEAIRKQKDHLKAHLLEFRLYKDDVGLSLIAMKNLLWVNLKYLRFALKPMLILSIPTILLLIQLAAWYEYRPLLVGESTILSVKLSKTGNLEQIEILVPEGLEVETPPLRIPQNNEIDWRIKAAKGGYWQVNFKDDLGLISKSIFVTESSQKLASVRSSANDPAALLHPAEETLPSNSFVEQIKVNYPRRNLKIFGWTTHWLVVFILGSILAGYSLKGLFKVQV